MPRITPCLWFDNRSEEAMNFYVSIFPNSRAGSISRYSEAASGAAGMPAGSVLTVTFELDGQEFQGLNGGPVFQFNEAVSFVINCDTQAEIDHYWQKLTSDGGEESQCGWLKDKFGVSWQVVPSAVERWMTDADPAKSERVMQAILGMQKIDLKTLEDAYAGR